MRKLKFGKFKKLAYCHRVKKWKIHAFNHCIYCLYNCLRITVISLKNWKLLEMNGFILVIFTFFPVPNSEIGTG